MSRAIGNHERRLSSLNFAFSTRCLHHRSGGGLLIAQVSYATQRIARSRSAKPNAGTVNKFFTLVTTQRVRLILACVIETSEWYVESKDRGAAIVAEVLNETRQ
jgi:hypothetical protein